MWMLLSTNAGRRCFAGLYVHRTDTRVEDSDKDSRSIGSHHLHNWRGCFSCPCSFRSYRQQYWDFWNVPFQPSLIRGVLRLLVKNARISCLAKRSRIQRSVQWSTVQGSRRILRQKWVRPLHTGRSLMRKTCQIWGNSILFLPMARSLLLHHVSFRFANKAKKYEAKRK